MLSSTKHWSGEIAISPKPEWYVPFSVLAKGGRNTGDKGSHAMLFSYFDDSADPRHERYFAAGGLIGSDQQWGGTFDVRWVSATHGLSDPFRSTDCECQQGQFKDWEKSKCDQLMADLVTLIRDYKFSAFASIVPIAEYRKVFPDSKEYDPYYLAVRQTIINMAVIGDRIHDDIKLWFEDSRTTSGSTLQIYNDLRAVKEWKPGRKLTGITFGNKGLCALQAADLVAREAFKHIDNLGVRKTRKPLLEIRKRMCFILWNADALAHLKAEGEPDDLELLTAWTAKGKSPQMTVFYGDF